MTEIRGVPLDRRLVFPAASPPSPILIPISVLQYSASRKEESRLVFSLKHFYWTGDQRLPGSSNDKLQAVLDWLGSRMGGG